MSLPNSCQRNKCIIIYIIHIINPWTYTAKVCAVSSSIIHSMCLGMSPPAIIGGQTWSFPSMGGSPSYRWIVYHGKSHRSKWMMTGGTSISGPKKWPWSNRASWPRRQRGSIQKNGLQVTVQTGQAAGGPSECGGSWSTTGLDWLDLVR